MPFQMPEQHNRQYKPYASQAQLRFQFRTIGQGPKVSHWDTQSGSMFVDSCQSLQKLTNFAVNR